MPERSLLPLPPQLRGTPWPTEAWPRAEVLGRSDVAAETLLSEIDRLHRPDAAERSGETHAVVVIHRGELVAERYGNDKGPDTTLISWSMAKSILHALVGVLVREGRLDVHRPAPVPAWQADGDPRARITTEHLLRMVDGLDFIEDYVDGELTRTRAEPSTSRHNPSMAFGQQSGPPATRQQLDEFLELLERAGHADFRDARGPMGFTQRQAGGRFTRDEAQAFIDELIAAEDAKVVPPGAAEDAKVVPPGAAEDAKVVPPGAAEDAKVVPPAPKLEIVRPPEVEAALRELSDGALAAELRRRGWAVTRD